MVLWVSSCNFLYPPVTSGSRYGDWLRAGRPGDQSSSNDFGQRLGGVKLLGGLVLCFLQIYSYWLFGHYIQRPVIYLKRRFGDDSASTGKRPVQAQSIELHPISERIYLFLIFPCMSFSLLQSNFKLVTFFYLCVYVHIADLACLVETRHWHLFSFLYAFVHFPPKFILPNEFCCNRPVLWTETRCKQHREECLQSLDNILTTTTSPLSPLPFSPPQT